MSEAKVDYSLYLVTDRELLGERDLEDSIGINRDRPNQAYMRNYSIRLNSSLRLQFPC